MQKLSATRWAKELTNKMYAGDFEGAEAMGKRMAHAGLKPRRVGTSIGSGADAVVDTLAGKIPGKQQPGLVAAKFISQERVGMSLGDHLKERAIVADLLGDLGAKNYGIYRKGQGAVELQEPITTTFFATDMEVNSSTSMGEEASEMDPLAL